MKSSLDISNFLEEISSLSRSVLFLYFFALIAGCDQCTKRRWLQPAQLSAAERPKPGGPHTGRAAAKRSYPTSEVRGSGRECQAATVQEQTRGATPRPRPRVVSGRSNPTPEARGSGQEKQPHIQGAVAAWLQERLEELSHVQGQEGQQ